MCVRLTSYGKFEDIARVGVLCHGKMSDSLRENDLEKKKKDARCRRAKQTMKRLRITI